MVCLDAFQLKDSGISIDILRNMGWKTDHLEVWERQFERSLCSEFLESEIILWTNFSHVDKCESLNMTDISASGMESNQYLTDSDGEL